MSRSIHTGNGTGAFSRAIEAMVQIKYFRSLSLVFCGNQAIQTVVLFFLREKGYSNLARLGAQQMDDTTTNKKAA